MITAEDILTFAKEGGYTKSGACAPDADMFDAFGIVGDDADEFMDGFSKRFGVSLDGFLSYFHYNANEPPMAETVWPYSPEGARLERIPLTPALLAEAATAQSWTLDYPEHLPKGAWKAVVPFLIPLVIVIAWLIVQSRT